MAGRGRAARSCRGTLPSVDADDHRFTIDPPELVDPELIVMLDGWIDASGVAAAAMATLVEDTDARELVTFDDDRYIDYRARRPTWELRQTSPRGWCGAPRLLWGQDRNGRTCCCSPALSPTWRGTASAPRLRSSAPSSAWWR